MSWDPDDEGDILRDYDSGTYSDEEICNEYGIDGSDLHDIVHDRDTESKLFGGGFLRGLFGRGLFGGGSPPRLGC